jgi:hypothetical protein
MSGASSMDERKKMHTKLYFAKLKGRDHFKNPSIDGSITLRRVLKNLV